MATSADNRPEETLLESQIRDFLVNLGLDEVAFLPHKDTQDDDARCITNRVHDAAQCILDAWKELTKLKKKVSAISLAVTFDRRALSFTVRWRFYETSASEEALANFANRFEDYLHAKGLYAEAVPEIEPPFTNMSLVEDWLSKRQYVPIHPAGHSESKQQDAAIFSPDQMWEKMCLQVPKPILWLRFCVKSGFLSFVANEMPWWVQKQCQYDAFLRRKAPDADTPESKKTILTERNTPVQSKRLRDQETEFKRRSQKMREQMLAVHNIHESAGAANLPYAAECNDFNTQFLRLFDKSQVTKKAEAVEYPKHGWGNNLPLLTSSPGTESKFLSPMDVFQQILAACSKVGITQISRIQFWASSGNLPLFHYNTEEECDGLMDSTEPSQEEQDACDPCKKRVCLHMPDGRVDAVAA